MIYGADIGSSLSLLFRIPIRMAHVSDLYISFRLYYAGFFPTLLLFRICINMNAMHKKKQTTEINFSFDFWQIDDIEYKIIQVLHSTLIMNYKEKRFREKLQVFNKFFSATK